MDNGQYEIQKAIENDSKRLGEVWQFTNEGKSAAEIEEKWGSKTQLSNVYNRRFGNDVNPFGLLRRLCMIMPH